MSREILPIYYFVVKDFFFNFAIGTINSKI